MAHSKKRPRSNEEQPSSNEEEPSSNIGSQVSQEIDNIQSALLSTSSAALQENIRSTRTSASVANSRIKDMFGSSKSHHTSTKKALDSSEKFLESDNIMLQDTPLSVGTLIKRAALKKYDKYKSLDDEDKNLVALGANGIVDMSKRDSVHLVLLGRGGLENLRQRFHPVLQKVDVFEGIDVGDIEKKAKVDIGKARQIAVGRECTLKNLESTVHDTYAEYLKVLQFRKKIFRKDIDNTEGDLVAKVWAPILESVMRDEEDIRLKWGESVGDSSGVTTTSGFKVDVRAVYDRFAARRTMKEVDTGNIEIARPDASVAKVAYDKVKLFIENKCVVDRLIYEGVKSEDAVVPCLQLSGLQVVLYSVRLVADGLYVAVEEGKATIPKDADHISNLQLVINLLHTFRKATSVVVNTSQQENDDPEEHTNLRRGTWIPPSNNNKTPPLPHYLLQ